MDQKTAAFEEQFKGLSTNSQNGHQNGLILGLGIDPGGELRGDLMSAAQAGLFCLNCGAALEGRKCKLFCLTPGCGYLVTCSEW